ncbi:MAG TPA: DUF1684 domain-containing protein [Candidatus Binatia bacterium]|nr:DUF1684 domain-containing protein [Candidatus Binatia bacterium]
MPEDETSHAEAVEAWRSQRYAALRRDIGWLTLAGLGWLQPGVNRVGAAAANDVVLPSGPAEAGTITVADGEAVADGAFLHDGRAASGLRLVNDQEGEVTLLELGSLRLCVIERGGRLAVRTWDFASPARRRFDGIEHWPVDPAWRLVARFEATPDRTIRVPDVMGIVDEEASPGDVVFEIAGAEHRLQALPGGDTGEVWLVFGDATNGDETYGGGRFLYTSSPSDDGSVDVDFNRAYNPPCVFSPFATCPLPWPENRLPVRIEAGERIG